ncbi:MAG: N-succinyldiaminopimelate aminotransferase [Candidatus Azotimanducaceae bacterium]|jgi:N-succinyldiaminopimelate aminotransferase
MSNRRLDQLHPYPFEQLNQLLAGVTPADLPFISLALGEPKHETANFLIESYRDTDLIKRGFGAYPPTKGLPELRESIAAFITQRFNLPSALNPDAQVLPVNGSREGLFALAQALVDPEDPGTTIMPNPFYQIYEGAALIAGSEPYYMPCTPENNFLPDLSAIPAEVLQKCQLMYLCSPGNPSGAVMTIEQLQYAIALATEYDFVLASDECYSEIYADEDAPPPGLLDAAAQMGHSDFRNCIIFNSLSKRSNLPGLRSGYVAGDANLIRQFLLYRTYHGSAMSVHNQLLSTLAWQDEDHVVLNRTLYREKYQAIGRILENVWPMSQPTASFYLWPATPDMDDTTFAKRLIETTNIKVLPGSYLSREIAGVNPGENRVRMALVATVNECVEAAERIRNFMQRGGL